MGITNSNKEISVGRIDCGGEFKVTLSVTATPDIVSSPADIVLVLDRSGSMAGSPLANLKSGVKTFIDIVDQATDSAQDGYLGYGTRMGIVSFSDTATQDCPLTSSVAQLKDAVDGLSAGGSTNHANAFEKAGELFDCSSSNQKVLIMFTDGETTAGPAPAPVAASLRAEGVIIYCIGLKGSQGLDEAALNDWATDPDSTHVFITPDDAELSEIFKNLAINITKPGATDISIEETVTDDFQIISVMTPTKGSANLTGPTTLTWTIGELGAYASEGAVLEFLVRHVGSESGLRPVNASVVYQDAEGNQVSFPSPSIQVDCDLTVIPEECPQPVDLTMDSCQSSMEFNAGDLQLEGLGRILQLDVRLKNVCPGRRVALAVILTEEDEEGTEQTVGTKIYTVPAHSGAYCRDILVKCIPFVVPEKTNFCGGGMCAQRRLKARFLAQYLDVDLHCCHVCK